jgi:two-component system, cell cycle sensor histidine kinase and response regulator CckA
MTDQGPPVDPRPTDDGAEPAERIALLQSIVETDAALISRWDAELRLTFVNRGYEQIYGRHAGLVGRRIPDLEPSQRAQSEAHFAALTPERPQASGEYHMVDPQGRERWIRWTDLAFFDADGRLLGGQGIGVDVTDRVEADAERRALTEQLERSLRLEAVGRLAGGLAHDVNNLLTAILGHCELAAGELPLAHPAAAHLDGIERAAERAAELAHRLLAVARRQVREPVRFDVRELVASAQDALARLVPAGTLFSVDGGREPLWIEADRNQLDQVLVDLVVNARDATPAGGRIAIGLGAVDLSGAAAQAASLPSGPYVAITVADTGDGISTADLAHIFEPFFTTKSSASGAGLGLSVVDGVVRQNGGAVTVTSTPGDGSRFVVHLPRVVAPLAATIPTGSAPVAPQAAAGGRPEERRPTVLLAEDEDAVRHLVRRVLGREGFHVLEASRGTEALVAAHEHEGPIDLLVTDVVMPGVGGRTLAERLRIERPDLAVLFVSGYADGLTDDLELSPRTAFLAKPFRTDELVRKVREALAGGR